VAAGWLPNVVSLKQNQTFRLQDRSGRRAVAGSRWVGPQGRLLAASSFFSSLGFYTIEGCLPGFT